MNIIKSLFVRSALAVLFFIVFFVPATAQGDSTLGDFDYPHEHSFVQHTIKNDSLVIEVKAFDEARLADLKSDGDLNYKLPPTVAESLWDRFKMWLYDLFISMFSKAVGTNWGRIFLYTAGIILLIVLIMTLLKVDAFRMLYGTERAKLKNLILDEDIQAMDFDKLLDEAIQQHDYRRGVRLLFLYALKMLSDKHLIQLESGKTNHDYVEEVNQPELQNGLNDLSFYFDYAWYGNFSISADTFRKAHGIFELWKTRLQ